MKYTLSWRDANDAVYSSAPFKPLNAITLDQADNGDTWFDPVPFPGTSKQLHEALKNDAVSMASLEGGHSGMVGEDGHVKIHFDVGIKPKPHITPKISADPHGCHVEYYVPECGSGDPCVHRFRNSWVIPYDMDIVAVHNHFHAAAINMTTLVVGGDEICVGLPTYEGEFLVETSKCTLENWFSKPFHVKRGQTILVETFYNQDERPHFGVMGFSMIFAHRLDIKDNKKLLLV